MALPGLSCSTQDIKYSVHHVGSLAEAYRVLCWDVNLVWTESWFSPPRRH